MILSGEKKEEYRELTDYWKTRMKNIRKDGAKTVTFSNGYAKDRDQFVAEINYIAIRTGLPVWGAEKDKVYFVIHLGKILTDKISNTIKRKERRYGKTGNNLRNSR